MSSHSELIKEIEDAILARPGSKWKNLHFSEVQCHPEIPTSPPPDSVPHEGRGGI